MSDEEFVEDWVMPEIHDFKKEFETMATVGKGYVSVERISVLSLLF